MAKKTANEEKEIEVGAIVSRSEEFIEKNKKKYYLGSTDINIPNEIITTNFGTVHRTRVLREIR